MSKTDPEWDHIEVRSDRPMPPARNANQVYPWERMEVGDSFKLPDQTLGNPYSVAGAPNRRFAPKKWGVRKTREGFICWRVK